MSRHIEQRLTKLEDATRAGKMHVLWIGDMSEAEIETEIQCRKAAGTLSDFDQLVFIKWITTGQSAQDRHSAGPN